MSQDLRVALVTSLNDKLVGPLRRALDEVEKNLKDVEKELTKVTQGSQAAGAALAGMQGPAQAAKQVAELARNTDHAVRLAEKLKNAWNAAGSMLNGVAKGMAVYKATKYVMSAPLEQARSYEKQLADAANIAFAGANKEARRKGMEAMDASVINAVRTGGGNRESALQGLNAMYAAGIDKEDVNYLLPHIQKYATAGNADPNNVANLAIFGLRVLRRPKEEIPLMLDKTLASTNVGSLEFDSLAKWMPQIGAYGVAAGMTGMKGYEQMLAGVQTSRLTAGTKDEAGTNFRDLMSHVTGHALMVTAQRMGIDAAGSIAKHIGGGGNVLSGSVALSDWVVAHDPRAAALQKKLDATKKVKNAKGELIYSPEQEDILRQQMALFSATGLGKLFHNQQSMQSLMALRSNRDYFRQNLAVTGEATGQIGEGNMELIRSTNAFKQEQLANEKLFAQTSGLSGVNNALGKLSEVTTDLYRAFPGLGSVVQAATWAIGGLATAAGAAGLAQLLFAKRLAQLIPAPPLPNAPPGPAVPPGAPGAAGTGLLLGTGGVVLAGGVLATFAAGSTVARNSEAFANMGADAGDTAFAAAIMNASQNSAENNKELISEVKALGQRPIKLYINEREIAASVDDALSFKARRN